MGLVRAVSHHLEEEKRYKYPFLLASILHLTTSMLCIPSMLLYSASFVFSILHSKIPGLAKRICESNGWSKLKRPKQKR